jgi:hypothetical protein
MPQTNRINYKKIRTDYPTTMTKEQFCKIAHIAKRTATCYLENGLIPCQKRNGKTHKYLIQTEDVVHFLQRRARCLQQFNRIQSPRTGKLCSHPQRPGFHGEKLNKWQAYLSTAFADFPDVMRTPELSKLCGYSTDKIWRWYREEKFIGFQIGHFLHIPKKSFLDYMGSAEYTAIYNQSTAHTALEQQFDEWLQESIE